MPRNFSSHSLQKKLTKIIKYQPSPRLIAVTLFLLTIFLISGGIYLIFMPMIEAAPYYRGLIIYPGIHDQTPAEGIAIMLTYTLGTIGLILIYRSIRYRHNPNQAHTLIAIGVMLLVIALVVIEAILFHKVR
ncbi:MAG: hypothetical protein QXJ19_06265 [Candidatus Bathyarchaeia archaeon]|nr:hypothetical protein [Candidatus Bathyarchaeota archaeon]